MRDRETKHLLILGGTREARELAGALVNDPPGGMERWSIISSLAGRTRTPEAIPGAVRHGGFGGTSGLRDYIATNDIDVIVDATHPFAETISPQAFDAARGAGRPYYRLSRAPWSPEPDDNWIPAHDIADAAGLIEPGATAFLTIGRQQLAPFLARRDIRMVARMIEAPDEPLPDTLRVVIARPPFAPADERQLMTTHHVDVVVTKNAGGDSVQAKLVAARDLGIPVIMIARPDDQPPVDATDVGELLALLDRHVA